MTGYSAAHAAKAVKHSPVRTAVSLTSLRRQALRPVCKRVDDKLLCCAGCAGRDAQRPDTGWICKSPDTC